MKIFLAAVYVLIAFIAKGQVKLELDQIDHCIERGRSNLGTEIFPPTVFDTAMIRNQFKNGKTLKQILSAYGNKAYIPNRKYVDAFKEMCEKEEDFGTLTWNEASAAMAADFVVKAKVVDMIDYHPEKCLSYATHYYLEIKEIFKANFKLDVGDTLILKARWGYAGGCAEDSVFKRMYRGITDTHIPEVGEVGYFNLNAYSHFRRLVLFNYDSNGWEDPICFVRICRHDHGRSDRC